MIIKIRFQDIFHRTISISLIIVLLFEMSCATIQRYPVYNYQPNELMRELSLIVLMKSGEQFEMTNISVTETHLVGIIIPSRYNLYVKSKEKLKIVKLEDIAYVQFRKTADMAAPTATGVCIGIMAGIGIIGLAILIACAIGGAASD